MKKRITAILLPLTLLAAFLFSAGCGHGAANGNESRSENELETKELYTGKLGTFEGLSAQTEWRILQDYYNSFTLHYSITLNDLYVFNYYGTYKGYFVVAIAGDGLNPYSDSTLGGRTYQIYGIVFPWPSPSYGYPYAWKNGKFTDIFDLYESGQLTKFDLQSIADYHKGSK